MSGGEQPRGRLITLEGVEGAGKSTNLEWIREYLEQQGVHPLVTREPGGTPLAEAIRELLLAVRDEPVVPLTELLLIFAARAQHVAQVIQPALAAGTWVLCDRFVDATYAYQGAGRELSMTAIAQLEQLVLEDLKPDLTLVLDLSWEQSMERMHGRSLDRFEREAEDFFTRVRAAYHQRAAAAGERMRLIDASQPLTEVQASLQEALQQGLAHWQPG